MTLRKIVALALCFSFVVPSARAGDYPPHYPPHAEGVVKAGHGREIDPVASTPITFTAGELVLILVVVAGCVLCIVMAARRGE